MKKPTKKQTHQAAIFLQVIGDYLQTIGAVLTPEKLYSHSLHTIVGTLILDPKPCVFAGPGVIFARFDDPQTARQHGVDCNPHSGKWNHHYFHPTTAEEAVRDFEAQIQRILPVSVVKDT